jgi:crotonobetainyl-CoA:carnitine CoA-transferase CaiB-like acyl-CoA transferase
VKKRTVLSLEQALSLSYGTLRFVHAGWRVIRLEATPTPGSRTPGDPNRYVGKLLAERDRRSYFVAPNVGKESIALNLKTEEGQKLLHRIVSELPVDVFCCNTLPRRYEGLGIDFETLRRCNPSIVWAGLSAFGPEYPGRPGYDPALQAELGYMTLTGDPAGPPTLCGVPVIDLKAGDELYAQVVSALLEQAETDGGAKRIDVSMARAAVSWLQTTLPLLDMGAMPNEVERSGNKHREFVPADVYNASDGYVYIAIGSDTQWRYLTSIDAFAALRRKEWATNEGRCKSRAEIHALMGKTVSELGVSEVVSSLTQAGVVVSEVNDVPGVRNLPSIAPELGRVSFPEGCDVYLPPSAIAGDAVPKSFAPPPRYGEHTRAVLAELGIADKDVDDMAKSGTVAEPSPPASRS